MLGARAVATRRMPAPGRLQIRQAVAAALRMCRKLRVSFRKFQVRRLEPGRPDPTRPGSGAHAAGTVPGPLGSGARGASFPGIGGSRRSTRGSNQGPGSGAVLRSRSPGGLVVGGEGQTPPLPPKVQTPHPSISFKRLLLGACSKLTSLQGLHVEDPPLHPHP